LISSPISAEPRLKNKSNMLTFISTKNLQTIVQISGHAIRDFLSQADAGQFKGEAALAIKSYKDNPKDFSDEKLIIYGTDTFKAIDYPVRIEVRGRTQEGAAQIVAKGIWGPKRELAAKMIAQQCHGHKIGIHLKLAGTSSIEFNIDGVDKSLPIHFLQSSFEHVLKEMNYQPGSHIDSRETRTVIAADGDATVYDGPRVGILPTLAESPVRDALIAYLKAGGIFMLVSGNDIDRSFKRIVDSLPKDVYCRVLVAANGGAELVYVNPEGKSLPVTIYRKKALDLAHDSLHQEALDIVYIGDDGSKEGNDYPAFNAVGVDRSVLVSSLEDTRQYIQNFLKDRIKK
jgi:hypothetical protein